jgi:hypothetical protein
VNIAPEITDAPPIIPDDPPDNAAPIETNESTVVE